MGQDVGKLNDVPQFNTNAFPVMGLDLHGKFINDSNLEQSLSEFSNEIVELNLAQNQLTQISDCLVEFASKVQVNLFFFNRKVCSFYLFHFSRPGLGSLRQPHPIAAGIALLALVPSARVIPRGEWPHHSPGRNRRTQELEPSRYALFSYFLFLSFLSLSFPHFVALTSNQLTFPADSPLLQLTTLETLWLSYNNIASLPDSLFTKLTRLKKLSCAYNLLTRLNPNIGALLQLEKLVVKSNQLSYLPGEILTLPALKVLEATPNPFLDRSSLKALDGRDAATPMVLPLVELCLR
jgi:Leucine-rich repeat (LRR) protein